MQPFSSHYRTRRGTAESQRRHRSDHPEAVLETDRADRVRTLSFFRLALLHDGSPNPTFELNAPRAAGATILLAGANFGCGSSREHAPWALADYGFRSIIASSFADIFYGNCCQNGLLPVTLPDSQISELFARAAAADRGYDLTVDLQGRRVYDGKGFDVTFAIDDYRRDMLLSGLDEIGRTLLQEDRIAAFERRRRVS